MENYADVLESYVIVEEGFGDIVKKAGKAIWKGIMFLISKVRKMLKALWNRISKIFSRKPKVDPKQELENEIRSLRAQLAKKDNELQRTRSESKSYEEGRELYKSHYEKLKSEREEDNDRYRQQSDEKARRIAELKQRAENAEKLAGDKDNELSASRSELEAKLKELEETKKELSHINVENTKNYLMRAIRDHTQTVITFCSVMGRNLPKFEAEMNNLEKDPNYSISREKRYNMRNSIPTKDTGNWSYSYKVVNMNVVPQLERLDKQLKEANADSGVWMHYIFGDSKGDIGNMLAECDKTLASIEKVIGKYSGKDIENPDLENIVSDLTEFVNMCNSSTSLMNSIVGNFMEGRARSNDSRDRGNWDQDDDD